MKIIINQGREILLLGSVRESIMTPSETSSEKTIFQRNRRRDRDISAVGVPAPVKLRGMGPGVVMQEADTPGQHSLSAVLNGSSEFFLGYCSKPLHF
jgi:hypothetical protein